MPLWVGSAVRWASAVARYLLAPGKIETELRDHVKEAESQFSALRTEVQTVKADSSADRATIYARIQQADADSERRTQLLQQDITSRLGTTQRTLSDGFNAVNQSLLQLALSGAVRSNNGPDGDLEHGNGQSG